MDHAHSEDPFATACVNLPDDLFIWEILVRLPVKYLMIYKASRSWRAAIVDPGFVRRNRDISCASPPSMLIIPRKTSFENDSELSEDIIFHRLHMGKTIGTLEEEEEVELMLEKACPPETKGITNKIFPTHCDGLVAIATMTDQVFMCNPATQELVALPLGTPDVRPNKEPSAALGFDSSCNQYVVVRYFYRQYDFDTSNGVLDYEIGHEVFVLGGDSWELTDDPPDAISDTRPVFMQGSFYWGTYGPGSPQSSVLVRFILRERMFDVVPCPPGYFYNYDVDHLADLGGKLCYVNNVSETTFDVWQLEDDGRQQPKWSLRCRIDPFDDGLGVDAFFPIWAGGGGIMVAVDYEKLYWCDEKSGYIEELIDLGEEMDLEEGNSPHDNYFYRYHIIPYKESLISIKIRNY